MSNKIKNARRVMKDAFAEDPDFRHGYQANIAMAIYDKLEFSPYAISRKPVYLEKCNEAADSIIKLIFESGFDDKPATPTLEFINSLLFETIPAAQAMLNAEYPGYTVDLANDGHIIYDPKQVPYASISSKGHIVKKTGKFDNYDHALKDLLD